MRDVLSFHVARWDLGPRLGRWFQVSRTSSAQLKVLGAVGVGLSMLVVLGLLVIAWALDPTNWSIDVPRARDGVSIHGQLEVGPPNLLVRLERVQLFELADEGTSEVPLAAVPAAGGALQTVDGQTLLKPDRSYRLVLTGAALDLGLPWPKPVPVVRELTFTTQPSPRPLLPSEPAVLTYGQELVVEWSQPVEQVEYRIEPAAEMRLSVDTDNPRRIHIALESYQDGIKHLLTFTHAVGANGVTLQQPFKLEFVTPVFPHASMANPENVVQLGRPLELWWNTPLRSFEVQAPEGVSAKVELNQHQPRIGYVNLDKLAQGREYELVVSAATGINGAPLKERQVLRFRTPPPLALVEFGPQDGQQDVNHDVNPYVTFSQPVEDRAAAERAFQIEPFVPGRFEWESPTTMVYRTEKPFDYEQKVTMRLAGGPEAVRGVDGSFLERDLSANFTIEKDRYIDISLSQQVLRLIEGDQVVFSTLVATGLPGAETPAGTWYVQYKMATARFRGVNPNGRRYDISNVPWVLAFWGDYTIHGAPWRYNYGQVGSNGCVSMPTAAAKHVYDWAEVGTRIEVHY